MFGCDVASVAMVTSGSVARVIGGSFGGGGGNGFIQRIGKRGRQNGISTGKAA